MPTLTIAAKNLATEMANCNVEEKDPQDERAITSVYVQNNLFVPKMLSQEELPPSIDIKKLERRVKSQGKKLAVQAGQGRQRTEGMTMANKIGTAERSLCAPLFCMELHAKLLLQRICVIHCNHKL